MGAEEYVGQVWSVMCLENKTKGKRGQVLVLFHPDLSESLWGGTYQFLFYCLYSI